MGNENRKPATPANMTAVEAANIALKHGRALGVPGDRDDTLRRGGSDEPRGTRTSIRTGSPEPILPEAPKRALKAAAKRARDRRHSPRRVAFFRYSYYEPAFRFFTEHVLNAEFVVVPPATRRTIELGDANSSDFVCSPFKRMVGDYAEALDRGADVLVQFTGFCRLTYYGELQEMILHDMGYKDFTMLNFSDVAGKSPAEYIKFCKRVVNPDLSIAAGVAGLLGCYKMAEHLDEFMAYYLANAAFEVRRGSFERVRKAFFRAMNVAENPAQIDADFKRHMAALQTLELNRPTHPVRVGLMGDYYTAADAEGNMEVAQKLIDMGVSIALDMTISDRNLHYDEQALRHQISEYVKYDMGPTSSFNIAAAKRYAEEGFDGVIHMKAAGCTPEIDVMPVLQRLSRDYKMPVLFLTFDSQTSDTGLMTRLEAFYDMISMRKERA